MLFANSVLPLATVVESKLILSAVEVTLYVTLTTEGVFVNLFCALQLI